MRPGRLPGTARRGPRPGASAPIKPRVRRRRRAPGRRSTARRRRPGSACSSRGSSGVTVRFARTRWAAASRRPGGERGGACSVGPDEAVAALGHDRGDRGDVGRRLRDLERQRRRPLHVRPSSGPRRRQGDERRGEHLRVGARPVPRAGRRARSPEPPTPGASAHEPLVARATSATSRAAAAAVRPAAKPAPRVGSSVADQLTSEALRFYAVRNSYRRRRCTHYGKSNRNRPRHDQLVHGRDRGRRARR